MNSQMNTFNSLTGKAIIGSHNTTGICPCVTNYLSSFPSQLQDTISKCLVNREGNTTYHVVERDATLNEAYPLYMDGLFHLQNTNKHGSKAKLHQPHTKTASPDTHDMKLVIDMIVKLLKTGKTCDEDSTYIPYFSFGNPRINEKGKKEAECWLFKGINYNYTIEELAGYMSRRRIPGIERFLIHNNEIINLFSETNSDTSNETWSDTSTETSNKSDFSFTNNLEIMRMCMNEIDEFQETSVDRLNAIKYLQKMIRKKLDNTNLFSSFSNPIFTC